VLVCEKQKYLQYQEDWFPFLGMTYDGRRAEIEKDQIIDEVERADEITHLKLYQLYPYQQELSSLRPTNLISYILYLLLIITEARAGRALCTLTAKIPLVLPFP
jgi:hypothetical protein